MAERRTMMWVVIAALCCVACSTNDASRPPNVLLIVVDDLGWNEPGFMGSDFFETPALDRLAAEGIAFSDAYACAATCSPSRACILSGQYTPRHGLFSVPRGPRPMIGAMRLVPPISAVGLSPHVRTLAEAGYETGMFGKWHLGTRETMQPAAAGFGEVVMPDRSVPAPEDDPKWSRAITDALLAFIDREHDRPFFAYVGYVAVHGPGAASAARVEAFREKAPGKLHHDPVHAAMLAELDDQLGRVFEALEVRGLAERTLVIVTSDNGGRFMQASKPLRGAKGSHLEGGIRVPLVMRWPGVVAPGATSDVPTSNVDFYPTLLELAGGARADGQILDGASLLPLMRGGELEGERALYWHLPMYGSRDEPVSVIRKGRHKLVLAHEPWLLDGGRSAIDENGAVRLYDVVDDPTERHDLAAERPGLRDALLDELLAWIEAVDAPWPTKPTARRSRPPRE